MSGSARAGAIVRARRVRRVLRCLVTSLLVALAPLPDAADAATLEPGLLLRVDETTVYAGDSIMLEIEGVGLTDPPDLAPLSRDADLVESTGGTRIGVVGGQVVEIRTRRLELLPRGEGRIVFGPLVAESIRGTVRSNAVAVDVLPPPDIDWTPGPDDVDIAFTVSSTTPVLGERVVAELVLRHRHAIAGERIELPAFDGFDVLAMHERRRTVAEDEDGVPWRQIAWRWLLFPTRSGAVSIAGVDWRGEMIRSRTQRGPFALVSPATGLDVAPAAEEADGWWLPARNVTLEEDWSTDLGKLSAGDELVRTITLTAEDVLARQLPAVVPLESLAIESTPLSSRREHRLVGERLVATATFEFRMQARSPVPVFLDTVRVGWWDTVERRPREAIVPARRIDVGLPERADLLAELALADRGLDRVRLALESVGRDARGLRASLAVLGAWAAWLLVGAWRERRRRRAGRTPGVLPEL